MKTRIIKHTKIDEVWYTVQYKQLLFWHTLEDVYGYEIRYFNLDKAKQIVHDLSAKEIKEVVK